MTHRRRSICIPLVFDTVSRHRRHHSNEFVPLLLVGEVSIVIRRREPALRRKAPNLQRLAHTGQCRETRTSRLCQARRRSETDLQEVYGLRGVAVVLAVTDARSRRRHCRKLRAISVSPQLRRPRSHDQQGEAESSLWMSPLFMISRFPIESRCSSSPSTT